MVALATLANRSYIWRMNYNMTASHIIEQLITIHGSSEHVRLLHFAIFVSAAAKRITYALDT
jgi:hypothetical protein